MRDVGSIASWQWFTWCDCNIVRGVRIRVGTSYCALMGKRGAWELSGGKESFVCFSPLSLRANHSIENRGNSGEEACFNDS